MLQIIYQFTVSLLLVYLMYFLAGFCSGWMDTIQFHWHKAPKWMKLKESFWNPAISWTNKWKKGFIRSVNGSQKSLSSVRDPQNGERFPFSSTLLVFLTDGWHLLKSIMIIFMCAGTALSLMAFLTYHLSYHAFLVEHHKVLVYNWWQFLLLHLFLCRIAFGLGFKLRYK